MRAMGVWASAGLAGLRTRPFQLAICSWLTPCEIGSRSLPQLLPGVGCAGDEVHPPGLCQRGCFPLLVSPIRLLAALPPLGRHLPSDQGKEAAGGVSSVLPCQPGRRTTEVGRGRPTGVN